MTGFDTHEWQGRVGKSWAHEWRRTDRSFRTLTAELHRRIAAMDFAHALDVGCGAGELSLEVARSRPGAHVIGVDISPDLIAVARERASGLSNIEFELADAAAWQPNNGVPADLLMSRHGVMFFIDPVQAFSGLHRATAPGGQMIFSCFRSIADNPFFSAVGALVEGSENPPDPHAPGPFAFADDVRVRAMLADAGWQGVSIEPFDFRMIAGAGEDPVVEAVAYFSRIGPAARAISQMDDTVRAAFREKLVGFSQSHLLDGEVGLGAGVWIVTARRD